MPWRARNLSEKLTLFVLTEQIADANELMCFRILMRISIAAYSLMPDLLRRRRKTSDAVTIQSAKLPAPMPMATWAFSAG